MIDFSPGDQRPDARLHGAVHGCLSSHAASRLQPSPTLNIIWNGKRSGCFCTSLTRLQLSLNSTAITHFGAAWHHGCQASASPSAGRLPVTPPSARDVSKRSRIVRTHHSAVSSIRCSGISKHSDVGSSDRELLYEGPAL